MRFYMLLAVALLLNSAMSADDVSIRQTDARRREERDDTSNCSPSHPYFCLYVTTDVCCSQPCDDGNRCNSGYVSAGR
uniref:Ctr_156_T conopeptide n=1 Tax=Conus tribblei TaxID=101761 RepID=A0A0C9S5W2_CONTD